MNFSLKRKKWALVKIKIFCSFSVFENGKGRARDIIVVVYTYYI